MGDGLLELDRPDDSNDVILSEDCGILWGDLGEVIDAVSSSVDRDIGGGGGGKVDCDVVVEEDDENIISSSSSWLSSILVS